LGQTLAFVIVLLTTHITAAESLIAWGAGALGAVQLSVKPHFGRVTLQSAREMVRVGAWFTGANVIFSAGLFGVAAIVAAEVGSRGLGLFRMVQGNMFGPVQLMMVAAEMVFFPHLVRRIRA